MKYIPLVDFVTAYRKGHQTREMAPDGVHYEKQGKETIRQERELKDASRSQYHVSSLIRQY